MQPCPADKFSACQIGGSEGNQTRISGNSKGDETSEEGGRLVDIDSLIGGFFGKEIKETTLINSLVDLDLNGYEEQVEALIRKEGVTPGCQ